MARIRNGRRPRHHQAPDEVPTSSPLGRRRRGLGPFSGGQLTAIVITLVVMIGFPFAAFAVTGSNVFVTDATTGNRAKVDNGGHALVGDGSGALTVDGTVNNRATLPTKPILTGPTFVTTSLKAIFGPVSKPFGVTSLTISNFNASQNQVVLYATTSAGGQFLIENALVPPKQTLQLTYPSPLIATPPTGGTAGLAAQSLDGNVEVNVVGYQT